MKKAGLLVVLIPLLTSQVYAADVHVSTNGSSNVSVNSTSEGTSTTCVNGECTTTGGESKSTVCINGKCQETNGDFNYEDNSNGGTTKVEIKNNTSSSNTTKSTNTSKAEVKVNNNDLETQMEASKAADKEIEKVQETRKSILDQITEFFKNFFPFF